MIGPDRGARRVASTRTLRRPAPGRGHARRRGLGAGIAALVGGMILVAWPDPIRAQPYARFAVPDSALAPALASARADFESAWNALLVAELRATLARADSAQRLATLERSVAGAEPRALGSRIAPGALALRRGWKKDQLRLRVDAAVAESLAAVARAAHDHDRADSLFHRALAGYRALKERRREAWVLGSLGANALVAGNNAAAAAYYGDALAARRALGDSILIGNTLSDLGQTWLQLGQPERAAGPLREAAAIREAQRRWSPLGKTLNFLGLALATLGQPDSALLCYRRALLLTSQQGDSATTLVVLKNYGLVLVDQARTSEAIPVHERALALATSLNALRDVADVENNLGYLYRTAGHYGQALEHFDRAIEAFTSLGDLSNLALSSSRKGLTLINAGELEEARRVLRDARAVVDSIDDPRVQSRILSTQAVAAEELDDVPEARRLASRALAAATTAGDSTAIHDATALLGFLAAADHDGEGAERWMRRAIAAGAGLPVETRVNDLTALGAGLQLAGRLDEAEREHQSALATARAGGLSNQMLWSLCCLGDVEERRGRHAAALDLYGRAAAMAETLRTVQRSERRSIALFANRLFMFGAMIHLMGKLDALHPDSGYAERSFEWAERARARSFLDLVAATGERRRAGGGVDEPGGERTDPPAATILTLRDAQRLLRSDREALLEYSVGDSSTSLWVIRRDRWKRFTLPPRAALQARVQALRRGLANPDAMDSPVTRNLERVLYRQLIAPAESLLAGADRLIVAPDGALSLIPFEALLAKDAPQGAPPAPGSYLVERYAIAYTPSASVLATRADAGRGTGIVAIGNPRFGMGVVIPPTHAQPKDSTWLPLAPLPNTAAEIELLRSVRGRGPVVTLTGAEAHRDRVLALDALPRADVIHIATHGDVNEAEPERSGLWLARSPVANGDFPTRMEVADILALHLQASLVTLSACETGLGRLESGEGVVGLSRAFMAAGARSVLVSLWPVNDRSTADLMAAFYRKALDGKTSRADALAAAKRAMLGNPETRAPYYWAPFILIGQSGR